MTGDVHKTAGLAAAGPQPDGLPPGLSDALRRAADLSRVSDPRLTRALAWWQGLQEDSALIPDRIRLDPTQIPDLLAWAILWDVLPAAEGTATAPGRLLYRCRLAGTMLNDFYGREARGQWLHEQYRDESVAMQVEYDAVVRLRRPLCSEHRMSWADKPFYRYLRLMLPFTHRAAAGRSDTPALRNAPDRVALIFSVISFIGE
ncbi:PAS domain-containing protein [Ferrovibrio terrae]|uniref:PAS domain-containing protein n=1 Tax=Ferrovibrio terrae TaxID=2594003 RepID=A0A516H724_9PROT|nr:PAS domain-containing protein [Ferrovibrio terrae]QDO99542.1 PAS domain-containing protein [Ferrovibrio terrae]